MPEPLRVLSLGAGVQSTALLLMILRGEFEDAPSCAIFADPGWESKHTYKHLERLRAIAGDFPIYTVRAARVPDIRTAVLASKNGNRWAALPFFTRGDDGSTGKLMRGCTKEYKIEPIQNKVRELLGFKARQRNIPIGACEQWYGISLEEAVRRMRLSRVDWIVNHYPLVHDRQMSRHDCQRWLVDNYPDMTVDRSACIGCPFHSNEEWRLMRDNRPDEWLDACDFDRQIRTGLRGATQDVYVHRSLLPLSEVDLDTDEDKGQIDMFGNECEGMCGV